MANNLLLNLADEIRAKFGCRLVNKCFKLGLTAADVTGRATLAALLAQIEVRKLSAAVNIADRAPFDMLKRECAWLQEVGIPSGKFTNAVINALTTVNTAAAATDLRENFYQMIQSDATFDKTLQDYAEFASGSNVY
jgi:hypothetical protein